MIKHVLRININVLSDHSVKSILLVSIVIRTNHSINILFKSWMLKRNTEKYFKFVSDNVFQAITKLFLNFHIYYDKLTFILIVAKPNEYF